MKDIYKMNLCELEVELVRAKNLLREINRLINNLKRKSSQNQKSQPARIGGYDGACER